MRPALEEAQDWADRGFILLGFLTYEASGSLDSTLTAPNSPEGRILAHWEAHKAGRPYSPPPPLEPRIWISPLKPRWDFPRYAQAFSGVKEALAQGNTYQVNLTMGFDFSLIGEPDLDSLFQLWMRATDSRPGPWQVLCNHPDGWILSLSPELFFQWEAPGFSQPNRVSCRPMKGTRPRGQDPEEDMQLARQLLESPKDRAENLMITDMIRNDLGKSALPGTVRVPRLFALETYPTVHQMVSDVTSRTRDSVPETLINLFPCASITGAPKVRTMEIIADLEQEPRGIYTGCLGRWDRTGAWFNVAIRTLELDREGRGLYRAGGGVVWDSDSRNEWEEIGVKTRILTPMIFPADLVETLKWSPQEGFFLSQAHLDRLKNSCRILGFPLPPEDLLVNQSHELQKRHGEVLRVRLVWTRDGRSLWSLQPLESLPLPLLLGTAPDLTDTSGIFFRHKTTQREVYGAKLADARKINPQVGEVLIRNLAGRITEGSFTNLAYAWGGKLWTPPLSDGLLPGLYRQSLLDSGQLEERPLEWDEVPRVEGWWVMNSVRGLMEARILI